ncbi:MAG: DNA polymerase I [Firmicutes bacterium HGW-Firmicutes-12]|nr:MAG: DNA polymerase I [Firmicutes bacterium HGW-Firmicutes-12]
MQGKFVLVDGNSLAYRAFYAIPMLSNSKGFITNAVYGFCNMLMKILDDEKPEYLAIAFDKGKIVFRHQDYEQYKATRKSMPDELRPQLPVLKELLRAMNVAYYECENYEADDIIGTLARMGEKENLEVLIVTGDRDALQLVSPHTSVLLTRKGITELEKYNVSTLHEKYGLTAEQMIDLKGLMGDSSDNIPGIPGVGEKTALKLIQEYGDMENALAHFQDFKGKKLGQLLEQYAKQARLSRKLAVIEINVPFDYELEECRVVEPDYELLLSLLRDLEFKGILQNMMNKMSHSSQGSATVETIKAEGITIDNPQSLREYLQDREKMAELIFFLSTQKAGVSGLKIKEIGFRVVGVDETTKVDDTIWLCWNTDNDLQEMMNTLKPWLEKEDIHKSVHDAKTALLACRSFSIELKGIRNDTLLMAYLLNPSRTQTDLDSLVRDYQGVNIIAENKAERGYIILNALDKLAVRFREELHEQGMWELYYDLELPLSRVLADLEIRGVLLDETVLQDMGQELDERLIRLTEAIYYHAGEEFNINSPKQLGEILFNKLGLPRGKKTKTGYSTSAEVLEFLAPEHEIVARILDYRQLIKIKTTYIDGLVSLMNPDTRKVHTSFNQTVTATGRLSSTEPNLQNIPIRMEEGRRLRRAFLPSPGYQMLSADYSQIELRVLAHIANDEVLKEAFHMGQDIHTRTAAEVFEVPMEAVNKEMRRAAKAVNFGIVYGISDFGLSQDLGISRAEAKEYIENYFKRYRGVRLYIDQVIAEARENGYVTTLLNRRRYLPDILSRNFHLRSFAERMAMNTPIQGSAADIIKLAMLRLQEILLSEKDGSFMTLQVHDELIFDVPAVAVEKLAKTVNEVMSSVYSLSVPLKVDLQTGPNWYELETLELNQK